jgi:hypothetical protein
MRSSRAALAACVLALAASAVRVEPAPPSGDCRLDKADHAVHGVILGNYHTGKAVLGSRMAKDGKVWRWVDRKNGDFPWYLFATKDGKQIAAFRVHPADVVNSYMEMEVRYRSLRRKHLLAKRESYYVGREGSPRKLDTAEFATNNGIKLGLSRTEVVERLGVCFKTTSRGSTETLLYGVGDMKAELPILKLANMPFYYAEYQFHRGKLVRYRFGYDYP